MLDDDVNLKGKNLNWLEKNTHVLQMPDFLVLSSSNYFRDHKVLAGRLRLGTNMMFGKIVPGGLRSSPPKPPRR